MSLELYYHPFSRAANVIWMLEEVGVDYQVRFVDMPAGEHKKEDILALSPIGKLPILKDGDLVVTESAAIGLYLADRYAPGRLAPALDDPKRGTYLRWSFFAPSVIEPGCYANRSNWDFREGSAGWGNYRSMLAAIDSAIDGKEYVLGSEFSMADVVFGGTVRFMLQFRLLDETPNTTAYVERLNARPASQRAMAKNQEVVEEKGLAGIS